jgi:hypothetical protein
LRWIIRVRQDFVHSQVTGFEIDQREVGKRPADVDAQRMGWLRHFTPPSIYYLKSA